MTKLVAAMSDRMEEKGQSRLDWFDAALADLTPGQKKEWQRELEFHLTKPKLRHARGYEFPARPAKRPKQFESDSELVPLEV